MKHLQLNFEKSGWHFEQIKRNELSAIYKRTHIRFPEVIYWEAIKIIPQDERTIMIAGVDVTFAAQEHYPSDEQFGLLGKCCMSIETAERCYLDFAVGETVGRTITSETTYPFSRGKKCQVMNPQN